MTAQTDVRPSGATDRDLASIQEARELARRARRAQAALAELSQERVDAIVDAMAAAVTAQAEALARSAVEETGFGVVADKVQIALKARCAIVLSPHPSAVRCISRAAEIMTHAARDAGAPDDSILWMTVVTL